MSASLKNLFLTQQCEVPTIFINKLILSESANSYTNSKVTCDKTDKSIYLTKPTQPVLGLQRPECFFLRKVKSFNKGRFSRNRQIYRTGVYFCFYINILTFYALWYYFYKFKLKFTYLWWLFILLPFSFIHIRALKFNLYFPMEFLYYLRSYVNWIFYFK